MLKHDAYAVLGVGRRVGFPVVLRPEGSGATGDIAWQSWGNFGRTIGRRCRQAAAFIAISQPIEDELHKAWGSGSLQPGWLERQGRDERDKPRIVAIPNGVPIPKTPWRCRSEWTAQPHAIYVGRLAPEKGLDTLIDAWRIVRSTYPNACLTLLGEGPERSALEDRVKSNGMMLGLRQAVHLPGAVAAVADALREGDLFVLPSREEGMSVALLEAMALGMPVVCSSIPGNQRLVTEFIHGRLATPGDPGGLARAVIDQWKNFEQAIAMGHAARTRVEEHFSIQAVARKHLELFQDIVAGRLSGNTGAQGSPTDPDA
jgi:glycosyltransferase involved in cell wall biosynthesis